MLFRIAAKCALALFSLHAASLRADIRFTPLGDLPGGARSSTALGLSADGLVVVGHADSANSSREAFRRAGGSMVGLGDLAGGAFSSEAYAASADGSVVVGFGTTTTGATAFRWQDGTMTSLGSLATGTGSQAYAVSADGSVVVGTAFDANSQGRAFRWTQAGGMTSLGTLPNGTFSEGRGVSANGSVIVGTSNIVGGELRAFRWTAEGGMVDLGHLGAASPRSEARAVSADGSTVVGLSRDPDGQVAFKWTAAGGMQNLGDLPGGLMRGEALAVSADGSVVVGTSPGANGYEAVIWDAQGLRTIKSILEAQGLAAGWTLTMATGVSADGTVITGWGSRSGITEAWVVDLDAPPPPPATSVILWTEDLPQTAAFKANSVLRMAYDNGTGIVDIATLTDGNAGFNGVEYADGKLLVANQGAGTGTRVHDPRYAPILVTNYNAYDLDAAPSLLIATNGNGSLVSQRRVAATYATTTTSTQIPFDRTTSSYRNLSAGQFTFAVQMVGNQLYYTAPTGNIGLFRANADTGDGITQLITGPVIYDFEIVGDQIYYGDITNSAIRRANLDGTGIVTLVAGVDWPYGIDVTDTSITWAELNTGKIRRSNLDGSNPVDLIGERTSPRGVVVLPLSFRDGPAPQAINVTGLALGYTGAANVPVSLVATSSSGLPVTLEVVSGPATITGSTITYTGSGTVVVRASQAGNDSFAPTSLEYFVTVTPRLAQTIDWPEANLTWSGSNLVYAPTATASSGLTVTYSLVANGGIATYNSTTREFTITGPGTFTVRANQSGSGTYAPATSIERVITVRDGTAADPFATWAATTGLAADRRGELDDPDGDGIENLMEYALGLDPTKESRQGVPAVSDDGTFLRMTYVRLRADLTYRAETTMTPEVPSSWTTTGVDQGTGNVGDTILVRAPSSNSRYFLRLKVTRP